MTSADESAVGRESPYNSSVTAIAPERAGTTPHEVSLAHARPDARAGRDAPRTGEAGLLPPQPRVQGDPWGGRRGSQVRLSDEEPAARSHGIRHGRDGGGG